MLTTDIRETCEVKLLKGGQTVHMLVEEIAASTHYGQGKLCRATVLDITASKLAEEKLAELDCRKDQLLAMLSHELRNPVGHRLAGVGWL